MNKEVEYLKEHLYEIYKYKKSMKDLTYDMDIELLSRTCIALDYSQQQIEKLNNIINKAIEYIEENLLNEESKDYCNLCKEDNIKIINILKGVDKE